MSEIQAKHCNVFIEYGTIQSIHRSYNSWAAPCNTINISVFDKECCKLITLPSSVLYTYIILHCSVFHEYIGCISYTHITSSQEERGIF